MPASRLDDIKLFQQTLLQARESGENSSAAIGVGSELNSEWLEAYCANGNAEFKVRAWILVDEMEGYLPLFGESKILKLLKAESRDFCGGV